MQRGGINAVIYDMDGVLLDTEGFYTDVTESIVQQYGKHFDWETKSRMMGRKPLEAARELVRSLELPITPEEYLTIREPLLRALFPTARPTRGAVELTQHLARYGIPQAVATSSPRELFALKTTQHEAWFNRVFTAIIRGDDAVVKKSKPAPDIFLAAAEALKVAPEQCLVFEDAPAGIAAARAAGMAVVAVCAPMFERDLFADADEQIASLKHFQLAMWGLPV